MMFLHQATAWCQGTFTHTLSDSALVTFMKTTFAKYLDDQSFMRFTGKAKASYSHLIVNNRLMTGRVCGGYQ